MILLFLELTSYDEFDDDRNVDFEKLKDRIRELETFAILMNNTNERDIWNMILKEGRHTYEWMRSNQ